MDVFTIAQSIAFSNHDAKGVFTGFPVQNAMLDRPLRAAFRIQPGFHLHCFLLVNRFGNFYESFYMKTPRVLSMVAAAMAILQSCQPAAGNMS